MGGQIAGALLTAAVDTIQAQANEARADSRTLREELDAANATIGQLRVDIARHEERLGAAIKQRSTGAFLFTLGGIAAGKGWGLFDKPGVASEVAVGVIALGVALALWAAWLVFGRAKRS